MEEIPHSLISVPQIIGFILSLAICALFSFLETSITALGSLNLKSLLKAASKYKVLFQTLEKTSA